MGIFDFIFGDDDSDDAILDDLIMMDILDEEYVKSKNYLEFIQRNLK